MAFNWTDTWGWTAHRAWTTMRCVSWGNSRPRTRLINKTGKTIVLQSKYRDIWEGEKWKLKGSNYAIVRWKPEVYKRLGMFVEGKDGQARGSVMYLNNQDLGQNEVITLTYSSFKEVLQLDMTPRTTNHTPFLG